MTPLLLVQFRDASNHARAGRVVDEGRSIETIEAADGVYGLARDAAESGRTLRELAEQRARGDRLDYAALVADRQLTAPIHHPDPAHCLLSGTGLTHLAGAKSRDRMHAAAAAGAETDSARMYRIGLEGGRPAPGAEGAQPEWFFKGDGAALVEPEGDLILPAFSEDGGEEAEIAGVYLIRSDRAPVRVGFALGNEFSDHRLERRNYLYLAHSKLRACAIGPEILVGDLPDDVRGRVSIRRGAEEIWSAGFASGEANMCHSIANLEHHHFKYPQFRRPGDLHIHFFGAGAVSFADGIGTQEGDVFEIAAAPFVKPLRNTLRRSQAPELARVTPL